MLHLLSILINLGIFLFGRSATMRHWLYMFVTVGDCLSNFALAAPGAQLSYLINCSNMSYFLGLRVSVWWVHKSVDVIMVKNFLLELLIWRSIVLSDTRLCSDLLASRLAWWCLGRGILRNLGVSHLQENPFAFLNRSILLLHECCFALLTRYYLIS